MATWKLTSTPLFVNNDLLTDLTPYIDKWEDKDDIPENIYNIMKEAGGSEEEMYVMPWNCLLYTSYQDQYVMLPYHKLSAGKTRSGQEAFGSESYPYLPARDCPKAVSYTHLSSSVFTCIITCIWIATGNYQAISN